MTPMPRSTVSEVLACLDDEFSDVAAAFARGEFLLWLGSGISRDVVPGVPELLERMLEFLRSNIDQSNPGCKFRRALDEVLDVAGVTAVRRHAFDLASAVSTWPDLADVINRLVDKYSDVLDVPVQGEAEDYLVWTGLNVAETYGSATLEPDVEHICIAVLMLEGVVSSAPTTNWDGLVEAAVESLTGDLAQALNVVVCAQDFQTAGARAELLKFHGCAVRAIVDEVQYRDRLIARKSQISGWTTMAEHTMMKQRLEYLFASRPALIIGLSAQDANIHTVLHEASQSLTRTWPTTPSAVVFAEQTLHHHHKHVMRVTYGSSYSGNVDAISESALLGAYAKPTLLGLVLFTLADKLCTLIGQDKQLSLPTEDLERLRVDLRQLRDQIGFHADLDPLPLLDSLVAATTLMLCVFRTGRGPDHSSARYQPLSTTPMGQSVQDVDYPVDAFSRLSMAIGLLSRGLAERSWELEAGSSTNVAGGAICITHAGRVTRTFVVRNSRVLSELEINDGIDLDDPTILVLQAESAKSPTTRSPHANYGRTGTSGARIVDLEALSPTVSTVDELFEAFTLESALS